MKRIVVAGGLGFFGSAITRHLRNAGFNPLIGSRQKSADLQLDVENRGSLKSSLKKGDVVIDAVGPFQTRSDTLLHSAMEMGFDVVDISDSLSYASGVLDLEDDIAASGIRFLTACSTVSTVSAAAIRLSSIQDPTHFRGILVPSTRQSAVKGSASSFMASIGRPIHTRQDGALVTQPGFGRSTVHGFPPPLGQRRGFLVEMADSITLPRIWKGLRTVEYFIDPHVPGLSSLLRLASKSPSMRRIVESTLPLGVSLCRFMGSPHGGVGFTIEGKGDKRVTISILSTQDAYITAVLPVALAVERLVRQEDDVPPGVVRHDRHVDPERLMAELENHGARVEVV